MARQITTRETDTGEVKERDTVVRDKVDQRERTANKLEQVMWFIITLVMVVLFIRFVLLLFGAQTGVPFVDFWYGLTAPLVKPFAGIFGTLDTYNHYNGMRLELESLIAMLVYGLLGYMVILGIRLMHSPEERNS